MAFFPSKSTVYIDDNFCFYLYWHCVRVCVCVCVCVRVCAPITIIYSMQIISSNDPSIVYAWCSGVNSAIRSHITYIISYLIYILPTGCQGKEAPIRVERIITIPPLQRHLYNFLPLDNYRNWVFSCWLFSTFLYLQNLCCQCKCKSSMFLYIPSLRFIGGCLDWLVHQRNFLRR